MYDNKALTVSLKSGALIDVKALPAPVYLKKGQDYDDRFDNPQPGISLFYFISPFFLAHNTVPVHDFYDVD